MNWVDFLIIGILAVSMIISLFRGFVREALTLTSWLLAFWIGLLFASRLAAFLPASITSADLRYGIAFGLLFIVSLVLGALFNNMVASLVKRVGLNGTDRALGVIFGFARGVAIIVLLVLVAGLTAFPQDPWWHHSLLIPYFQEWAIWVRGYLPAHLAEQITYG